MWDASVGSVVEDLRRSNGTKCVELRTTRKHGVKPTNCYTARVGLGAAADVSQARKTRKTGKNHVPCGASCSVIFVRLGTALESTECGSKHISRADRTWK